MYPRSCLNGRKFVMRLYIIVTASALGIIMQTPTLASAAHQDSAPIATTAEPDASPVEQTSSDTSARSPSQRPVANSSAEKSTTDAREPPSTVAIVANPIALL